MPNIERNLQYLDDEYPENLRLLLIGIPKSKGGCLYRVTSGRI